MRRFEYMLWLLVAVFCLMPCGVSAAETQKDLKIQGSLSTIWQKT